MKQNMTIGQAIALYSTSGRGILKCNAQNDGKIYKIGLTIQ